MIATVEHPVDRPLLANQDVNGRLLPRADDDDDVEDEANNNDNNNVFPLSDCTVGHLAQHKFCKILYEAAMGNDDDESNNTHRNIIVVVVVVFDDDDSGTDVGRRSFAKKKNKKKTFNCFEGKSRREFYRQSSRRRR